MQRAPVCALLLLALGAWASEEHHGHFTNDFVVEVDGGQDVADLVASSHGFKYIGQVGSLTGLHHFVHEETSTRSKRSADDLLSRLSSDPNVKNVEQQRILRRIKRRTIHDKQYELPIHHYADKSIFQRVLDNNLSAQPDRTGKSEIPSPRWINQMDFNDPYYRDQWYYDNKGQTGGDPGIDLNVLPVWKKGLTGKGVVVTILDDGIDHTHPDLVDNYLAEASTDLNSFLDNDPMPDVTNTDNSHGTRCAGEVAAKANNDVCGVGIAHNAQIGGVRMLDGVVTDILEGKAISFKRDLIDIYSASWGPPDTGDTMEGPGLACKKALRDGVNLGRHGKGSLFIWATGNGGMVEDDCNCDGYVSSIETISIGSMSDRGLSTYFSEVCPSTMAVVPCGGDHTIVEAREAAASQNPRVKVVTTDLNGDCTLSFEGTSSAAPMAAGAFALVLEANPDLTWRDVQHLVTRTARIPNDKEEGWTVNGGGLHVNPRFGFGVLDVGRMIEEAQSWQNVGPQKKCIVPGSTEHEMIPTSNSLKMQLQTDGCQSDADSRVTRLEHVQVEVKLEHQRRGDLTLNLTSPSGTVSTLLKPRPMDRSTNGIDFTFLTVHHWLENPSGTWELNIADIGGDITKRDTIHTRGKLLSWSMILWGADDNDRELKTSQAHSAAHNEISKVMTLEENQSNSIDIHYHKEREQSIDDLINTLSNQIDKNRIEAKRTLHRNFNTKDNDVDDVGSLGKTIKELQEILRNMEK